MRTKRLWHKLKEYEIELKLITVLLLTNALLVFIRELGI